MRRLGLGLLCAALLGLVACSGDDSGSPGGNNDNDGGLGTGAEPTKKKIIAAKGGTLETDGAKFVFPAGALGKDLEITIVAVSTTGLPDAKKIAGKVYELGPDGTTFDKPVKLTLDFKGTAPKGSTATVVWLDEKTDEWIALKDSAVDGQVATASTTHFTKFTVMFLLDGEGNGTQTGGQCADMDTSCGGSLVGTWDFTAGCATIDPKALFGADPQNPLATCEGIGVSLEVDLTGSITFNKDGTYALKLKNEFSSSFSVPKTCLGGKCSNLSDTDAGTDVTEDGDNCVKANGPETSMDDKTGTYTVKDNAFTTTEDTDGGAGEPGEPTEFCVDGDTLTAKGMGDNGTVIYYTATKQ